MKKIIACVLCFAIILGVCWFADVDLSVASPSSYILDAAIQDGNLTLNCILPSSAMVIDSVRYEVDGNHVYVRVYNGGLASDGNRMGSTTFSIQLPDDVRIVEVYQQGITRFNRSKVAELNVE